VSFNYQYSKKKHLSVWPWSDLISLCCRYHKLKKYSSVLEIGCGVGANIPFFLSKNFNYHGIDISGEAIKIIKKNFKSKYVKCIVGNYVDNHYHNKKFDLIVDRGAITCGNNKNAINKILELTSNNLKKDGLFIGIDWYSKKSFFYKNQKVKKSFVDPKNGPFSNIGGVYFCNYRDMKQFFQNFKIIHLHERNVKNFIDDNLSISSWCVVAKK